MLRSGGCGVQAEPLIKGLGRSPEKLEAFCSISSYVLYFLRGIVENGNT